MKINYKIVELGDAVFYWYDITKHIHNIFGDIVKQAFVCVGHRYNDDSEAEIWTFENKLECAVQEVERKLRGNQSVFFDYSQEVELHFTNGKVVCISSLDGFSINLGLKGDVV